jgi:hypothetical protein
MMRAVHTAVPPALDFVVLLDMGSGSATHPRAKLIVVEDLFHPLDEGLTVARRTRKPVSPSFAMAGIPPFLNATTGGRVPQLV